MHSWYMVDNHDIPWETLQQALRYEFAYPVKIFLVLYNTHIPLSLVLF